MTPAELRECLENWEPEYDRMLPDGSIFKLLLKLTDPTPIDDEFAASVDRIDGLDVSGYRRGHMMTIRSDEAMSRVYVTTRGDVYTLLWRAGLLDQLEEVT